MSLSSTQVSSTDETFEGRMGAFLKASVALSALSTVLPQSQGLLADLEQPNHHLKEAASTWPGTHLLNYPTVAHSRGDGTEDCNTSKSHESGWEDGEKP